MNEILLQRNLIFRRWSEEESSRAAGIVRTGYDSFGADVDSELQMRRAQFEVDSQIKELQRRIVQYHMSEVEEPYFFSVRKIGRVDIAIAKKSQRSMERCDLIFTMLVCVGISIVVFLKTRSYFENAWKTCQVIADTRKYVINSVYGFKRYATAQDIWEKHSMVPAASLLFLRNAFCFLFPFGGLLRWAYNLDAYRIHCPVNIHRSKDERICPRNFDIQNEPDPLTLEKISIQKLHSPHMIYLSNYVTDSKSFVKALLIAGKKDFCDPVYRRQFTEEEIKSIFLQIEKIFLISEEDFNACFEEGNHHEFPGRFLKDKRIFNETGELAREAVRHLQEMFGETADFLISETGGLAHQYLRDEVRRIRLNLLESTGYLNSLRDADKESRRIRAFESLTGVLLTNSE